MPCLSDLPVITYPHGAAMPPAVLGCPGGGTIGAFDTVELAVTDTVPGGALLLTVPSAQIIAGQDAVTIQWGASDLASLDVGVYGLTVIATLAGIEQKWRGQLQIVPAAS